MSLRAGSEGLKTGAISSPLFPLQAYDEGCDHSPSCACSHAYCLLVVHQDGLVPPGAISQKKLFPL